MVTVLKTVFAIFGERGFESHPLRRLGEEMFDLHAGIEQTPADKLCRCPLEVIALLV